MIDDIFSAQFHFEDPSGASSTRLFLQQTADNTSGVLDCRILSEALENILQPLITAYLSSDFWFTGVTVRKHYDGPAPVSLETADPQPGLNAGPGLPSNSCMNMELGQSTFAVRSNGRMYWPGIPEAQTNVGVMEVAYQSGPCIALANRLLLPFAALTDTGIWSVGVISQKVLNAAPPAKDWAGAFAFLTSVSVNPILAVQRRRTTKVIGAAV